jgi:CheY-like chemotaxis protein
MLTALGTRIDYTHTTLSENPERHTKGSGMDILLVDDNEDYLMLMKEMLYSSGYSVITANDGAEACEILDSNDIDLIVSDIKMPKLDGIKLHAFARETEKYKNTKFVFISGYKDVYADLMKLDPRKDFLFDKTMPANDIVNFVNDLMFGRFMGTKVAS